MPTSTRHASRNDIPTAPGPTDGQLAARYAPIPDADRQRFAEQGWLLVPGALDEAHRAGLSSVVDGIYTEAATRGQLRRDGSLHLLSAVASHPAITALLEHPTTFRYVWGLLGWNTYSHHSHIDVNPQKAPEAPFWNWHQDGYRQNSDIDLDQRPMLSLKVCFVLSDLSVPGRGATKIIPGSHRNNTLARTEDLRDPAGAMEIVAGPGDAFIFDRRMWHARSVNLSNVTRKLIFVGYTHRWIRPLDALPASTDLPWWNELSPVCQQLLGAGEDQSSFWGIRPDGWLDDQIPLRAELLERGLLDRTTCYLR